MPFVKDKTTLSFSITVTFYEHSIANTKLPRTSSFASFARLVWISFMDFCLRSRYIYDPQSSVAGWLGGLPSRWTISALDGWRWMFHRHALRRRHHTTTHNSRSIFYLPHLNPAASMYHSFSKIPMNPILHGTSGVMNAVYPTVYQLICFFPRMSGMDQKDSQSSDDFHASSTNRWRTSFWFCKRNTTMANFFSSHLNAFINFVHAFVHVCLKFQAQFKRISSPYLQVNFWVA